MSKKNMLTKDDSFWRELLSPEAYDVLRNKGTERAFSGKYVDYKVSGKYLCSGCGQSLFNSNTKFDFLIIFLKKIFVFFDPKSIFEEKL